MKRRSFLKASAALFSAARLQSFALVQASAQVSAAAPSGEIHVVGSGQDRFGESHSLGFSSILFKVPARETNGSMFVIEHQNLLKGGPPVHFHLHQDEWFYVMEGEVLFQVGDQRKLLRSGESVLGPRMIPHGFAGVGSKPGRMLIAFTPAGKMEDFFRAIAVPNGPARDAEVFRRYDMQYVGPPIKA
ncbi:MAG TPA: cupin domain-containing protein [Terracidiphilus sp.]|nr:cupin domain-containing protein [Terracidiphilus sp.]